jgi:hypothetical protein
MINYEAHYTVGTKPSIRKSIEASDGTFVYTNLNFSNEDERENASDEIINQHLTNLHSHLKDVANRSTLIPVGSPLVTEIIVEWHDLQNLYNEIIQWWMHVSFRPEDELHDDSDHTHDPETGEEIPNA